MPQINLMKFNFGVNYINVIDITLGIRPIVRIKPFQKILHTIKIIFKFFLVDFFFFIFINTISCEEVNRRFDNFNRTRRNHAAQQRFDTERYWCFGRVDDNLIVIFAVNNIIGDNPQRFNRADQFQINWLNGNGIVGIVMI